MTATRKLRVGLVVDGAGSHPAAWRLDDGAASLFTLGRVGAVIRRADEAGFDLAVIPDRFGLQPGGDAVVRGRLDAVLALAAVAPLTRSIGLVAVTDVTHTEPFHLSKNIATLDIVSQGRAGWWPQVSSTQAVADLFGRKDAARPAELWAETADAIEVVRRLWDSWEDDAVIRDVPTGRYIDRDKVHYVDFQGRFFSVRGPSITPRSPQGQPLVVLGVDDDSLETVAMHADIAIVAALDAASATARRTQIRRRAEEAGRDPDAVTVMVVVDLLLTEDGSAARALERRLDDLAGEVADHEGNKGDTVAYVGGPDGLVDLIADWSAAGALDGFLIRPIALTPTLELLADSVVPQLAARNLVGPPERSAPSPISEPPPGTLRERFGLDRPQNRYAAGELDEAVR